MNENESRKNKIYYVLGIMFIIIAVLIFPIHKIIQQKQMNYEAANGKIVVLFHHSIEDKELVKFTASLDSAVDVVQHIGDYALLKVEGYEKFQKIVETIQENPMVKVAQADQSIRLSSTSNDTYSNTQWAIDNPGYYSYISSKGEIQKQSKIDVDMNVPEAMKKLENNKNAKRSVIVAVIDTGVDYKHPDLKGHMWINQNEIPGDHKDNDGNGYIDDYYGWDFYNNDSSVCHYKYNKKQKMYLNNPKDNDNHGTHVAGIIGAIADNNIGIAGVASGIDIKIMSLKINGGYDSTGYVSSAIEAIKYAELMGADICNLSWGSEETVIPLEEVIKDSDMLFIASAGNTKEDNDKIPIYPASYKFDNMISVAYINANGRLADYSDYGVTSVDLAAPGEDILSTVVGTYATMSGTSMAAAQVSGIAAILYAFGDNLYPANVKHLLLNNIKHFPDLDGYLVHPGIPDANLIVDASNQLLHDKEPPNLNLITLYNKDKFLIPILSDDFGGSNIRTINWMIGKRSRKDFKKGFAGTKVENNVVSLAKPGIYTFYASDYAGNETIMKYEVMDDITAPLIKASSIPDNTDNSSIVTVEASDNQSGIKRIKYMKGIKDASYFLSNKKGTIINPANNIGEFKVEKDGVYTIFASDYRGNITTTQILVIH